MNIHIKTTTSIEDPAHILAASILEKLKAGKKTLLFLTGGSSVPVGAKVSEMLRQENTELLHNLSITLTDERYGPVGHPESNWQRLIIAGFDLSGAKLLPVLTGNDIRVTREKWGDELDEQFNNAAYKIALFGIGADGHIAGILPESPAVVAEGLATDYATVQFSRVTMTPKAIEKLDEAVIFAQGEAKWPVIKDLQKDIPLKEQPAQILKKVSLVTICTDYKE